MFPKKGRSASKDVAADSKKKVQNQNVIVVHTMVNAYKL